MKPKSTTSAGRPIRNETKRSQRVNESPESVSVAALALERRKQARRATMRAAGRGAGRRITDPLGRARFIV